MNQVPETLEVNAALGTESSEQISPDSGSGDRVVGAGLEGTVEANHLLYQVVGARVVRVRPGYTDSDPPSEWPVIR